MRKKRGGLKLVGKLGLLGAQATEGNFDSADLADKGRPHLEHGVGKAKLEDASRNGGDHGLVSDVNAAPRLLASARLGVEECVGVVGGEACGLVESVDLDVPGVGSTGAHTLGLYNKGEAIAAVANVADEVGVIPSKAGSYAALAVGTLGYYLGEVS